MKITETDGVSTLELTAVERLNLCMILRDWLKSNGVGGNNVIKTARSLKELCIGSDKEGTNFLRQTILKNYCSDYTLFDGDIEYDGSRSKL